MKKLEKITIRNLLTMTSGFTWDEWTTSYNDPDNDVMKLIQTSDWIKYVLDLPMSYIVCTLENSPNLQETVILIYKRITGREITYSFRSIAANISLSEN